MATTIVLYIIESCEEEFGCGAEIRGSKWQKDSEISGGGGGVVIVIDKLRSLI